LGRSGPTGHPPTGATGGAGKPAPLVSVVIPNLNGRAILGECLTCLRAQTYPNFEVIVVDNGSSDGSVEWVRERFPEVRVIALPANQGFAGGCNVGIRAARGTLIATLNNDARAEPTWLAEMVRVIEQPGVGMVASKMLRASNPALIDSAGICVDRLGIAWDRCAGHPADEADVEVDVFGPCGGAALYRRALFEDVGLFDEDFFCYLEDVDLAWRALAAGWRCRYAPRARVYHDHSATAVENSPFKRYHLGRNKIWMIAKNYPSPAVWWLLPAIAVYDLAGALTIAAAELARGASLSSALAGFRGRLDGLRGLPRAVRKRRAFQAARHLPSAGAFRYLEGPAWPWRVARRFSLPGNRSGGTGS